AEDVAQETTETRSTGPVLRRGEPGEELLLLLRRPPIMQETEAVEVMNLLGAVAVRGLECLEQLSMYRSVENAFLAAVREDDGQFPADELVLGGEHLAATHGNRPGILGLVAGV